VKDTTFDRVVVVNGTWAGMTYSRAEFLVLPLGIRIGHILARDIEFFLEDRQIAQADALRSLRR
jgi:hypothetical protein